VPEPALNAYRARLNGEGPVTELPASTATPEEAGGAFRESHGQESEEWFSDWKVGVLPDTAENNRSAIRVITIVPGGVSES